MRSQLVTANQRRVLAWVRDGHDGDGILPGWRDDIRELVIHGLVERGAATMWFAVLTPAGRAALEGDI